MGPRQPTFVREHVDITDAAREDIRRLMPLKHLPKDDSQFIKLKEMVAKKHGLTVAQVSGSLAHMVKAGAGEQP